MPIVGWGVAWVLGLGALDLLDGPARIVVVIGAWVIGMLLSWLPRRAAIRTGTEGRLRVAWVVVLIASPFLVVAAQPPSFSNAMLLLGGLWGLAMCLYGVATRDRGYAFVAGFGTVLAGVLAVPDLTNRLLWYGLGAGVPLIALGIRRMAGAIRHG